MSDSKLQSLSEIFNNKIFRIPDFQRGYSWEERQLDDFWEDTSEVHLFRLVSGNRGGCGFQRQVGDSDIYVHSCVKNIYGPEFYEQAVSERKAVIVYPAQFLSRRLEQRIHSEDKLYRQQRHVLRRNDQMRKCLTGKSG